MEKNRTTKTQHFFRIALGLGLLGAGVAHLTFSRIAFQAQVPNWVPVSKDLTVVLSGIVEIIFGMSLLFIKKYRIQLGWITALFFILVFPGNLAQYLNRIDSFGLDTDASRLGRLFFQPVLVLWALWSTGAIDRRNKE